MMDFHEFYEGFIEGDYIPKRINDDWLIDNDEYIKELLFSFYSIYSKLNNHEDMLKTLYKLYSEVLLNTFIHFEKNNYFNI